MALPVALLPCFIILFGSDAVLKVAIGAVALVAVFGRDLAYVQAGPLYLLDLILLATCLLAIPYLLQGAVRVPPFAAILAGIMILTLLRLAQSGISTTTLRQSVIGFYALWAVVGLAIASSQHSWLFARALALGSVVGLGVYGVTLLSPANPFSSHVTPKLIGAAGSLYAGFALLAVLLAPHLMGRTFPRLVLAAIGLLAFLEIAVGQVRSVWVGLGVAIPVTLLLSRFDRGSRQLVVRFAMLGTVVLVLAALLVPNVVGQLSAEAASIYSSSGTESSVTNAQWRLEVAEQALDEIKANPLEGIGFGPPQTYDDEGEPADLHNSFIGAALRLGIPGFLLIVSFEFFVLRSAGRALRSGRSASQRSLVQWLVVCQLLTTVHALFTVVLEGPHMGLFFWLLGGVIVGLSAADDEREAPRPMSTRPLGIIT